ncbi:MAG: hypothetical protein COV07_02155 [Candidatus Vogelbacteria bacterium CG10_big_fil_rev_8_21_14_0_10_45_14]|uniref:Nucleoside 2-deoxyribosyltransferase n=1 Tax=Candidatus Vogelbacteria bacterium CG10_big_fil_rev_8_21_14_0_10_45_14 TaxID=1975042 RepID=A0A2H0RM37_9BACT|nr:MAG: hypothetical protein COV07_02155 [Candidatus Vogelbacteria bacterium CG10_big_fil_rev_8_21_14_0_10_45_14]
MKIYILGSTKFVKNMVETTDLLIGMGLDAWIHPDYRDYVNTKDHPDMKKMMDGEQASVKIQNDYIRQHYDGILASDAILFVNNDKADFKNYIGGNALMEMGFAYVNDKKIYLKHGMPEGVSYMDEIRAMEPVCLYGDFSKLLRIE